MKSARMDLFQIGYGLDLDYIFNGFDRIWMVIRIWIGFVLIGLDLNCSECMFD